MPYEAADAAEAEDDIAHEAAAAEAAAEEAAEDAA